MKRFARKELMCLLLKIGLIGIGFIGMQHIEAIRRIPGVKISSIADRNLEKMEKLKSLGLCENIYTDYREMLANEDLDVVHNCTPTNLHYEINKLAIENDINIYSEKPLVMTSQEGDDLLETLKDKELLTGVNFNYRNNLLVQDMHERIACRDFGNILLVQGEYLQDWLMYDSDYDWRMNVEIGGKSRALADIGSHLFDILEYVTSRRIVKVNAKLFKSFEKRKKYQNLGTFADVDKTSHNFDLIKVENEDGALVQVEFEGGILGSLLISQVCAGKKNGLKINISGEKYALEWQQEQADRLWIGNRDKGNEEIYADAKYVSEGAKKYATLPNGHPVGWQDALTNSIKSFYRDVEEKNYGKEHPYATFEDANHILKVIDACFESDETGNWVKVKK